MRLLAIWVCLFALAMCVVPADQEEVFVFPGTKSPHPGMRVYIKGVRTGHTLQRVDSRQGTNQLVTHGWRPLHPSDYQIVSNQFLEFSPPVSNAWCYAVTTDNPPVLRRSPASGGRVKFSWRHYPEVQSLLHAPIGGTNWTPYPAAHLKVDEVIQFNETNNWIFVPLSYAKKHQWKLAPGWPEYENGANRK